MTKSQTPKGLAAVTTPGELEASRWRHYALRWAQWPPAEEHARIHLVPLLAAPDGQDPAWWFIRKHPCWRIRVDAALGPHPGDLARGLDRLVDQGVLSSWHQGIYEPETPAFGGPAAMAAAHRLFRADSHAILTCAPDTGRREISLTLCGLLLHGAGLEWYERGDLWHRVSHERQLPQDVTAQNTTDLAAQMRTLMLAGPTDPAALGRPDLIAWAEAFHSTGRELRRLADHGTLERGLRAVLSYHVIFHWNRMGLPARTQAILARAARTAIFTEPEPGPASAADLTPTLPAADLDRISVAFPLIREPRLHAAGLAERINEAASFADRLTPEAPAEQQIENACTVWNLAALICADCGLKERAAKLCETQFDIFRAAWPVSGRIAIASLQPLINLIRLGRRAGNPRAAHTALIALEHAVHHATTTTINGRTIDFAGFTNQPDALEKAAPGCEPSCSKTGPAP